MDKLKIFRIAFMIGTAVGLCLTGAGCEVSSSSSSSESRGGIVPRMIVKASQPIGSFRGDLWGHVVAPQM